jgi:hypothetical protein
MTNHSLTDVFKALIDAAIAFDNLPVRYARTRNGWAAYKGDRRITRFYFSEQGAREAVIEQDARTIPVV